MLFPRLFPCVLALGLGLAAAGPARADPTVGLGFSLVFGGKTAPEVGVGLRLFSNDDEDEFVASVGVDYLFSSQSVRPTVGVAYLFENVYAGADLGYNFERGGADFSIGLGGVDTEDDGGSGPPPAAAAAGTAAAN